MLDFQTQFTNFKIMPIITWWCEEPSASLNMMHACINDLVHDCSISSALALEILQSCTQPLTCVWAWFVRNIVALRYRVIGWKEGKGVTGLMYRWKFWMGHTRYQSIGTSMPNMGRHMWDFSQIMTVRSLEQCQWENCGLCGRTSVGL